MNLWLQDHKNYEPGHGFLEFYEKRKIYEKME